MDTRRRARNRSPSPIINERLITKKEIEECPQKYITCPSVPKKNMVHDYMHRTKSIEKAFGDAKAVFFNKSTSLSKLYDPRKNMTYLCQLYSVYETIGEGSFGIVYKARNIEDGKNYAIKLMKKYNSDYTNYNEIKRLEKIGKHENIIKFYFAWEEDLCIYLQLELCALSLAVYTKKYHNISIHQLWDIFLDMLHALEHLHERSLAHLDIKPDNIMMSCDGKYKLGDFGLLIDINENDSLNNKQCSQSEGDAKYLAKEVLEGVFTCAADIFSLGISMLELAADLVLPISGPTWHTLRDGTYSSPYFKMVPFKIRTVITKMMLPNYLKRLTVNELLNLNSVKRAIAERRNRPFTNYYELYKATNSDDNHVRPVAVCINPKVVIEAEESSSSNGKEINNADSDTNMEGNAEQQLDNHANSTCHTPPKRVSQVILYSI